MNALCVAVVRHGSDVLIVKKRGDNNWTVPRFEFVAGEDVSKIGGLLLNDFGMEVLMVTRESTFENEGGIPIIPVFFASTGREIKEVEGREVRWVRPDQLPDGVDSDSLTVLSAFGLR